MPWATPTCIGQSNGKKHPCRSIKASHLTNDACRHRSAPIQEDYRLTRPVHTCHLIVVYPVRQALRLQFRGFARPQHMRQSHWLEQRSSINLYTREPIHFCGRYPYQARSSSFENAKRLSALRSFSRSFGVPDVLSKQGASLLRDPVHHQRAQTGLGTELIN